MKVTISIPALQPIETFLSYLKERAGDSAHEGNIDVIADFIDRFIVVEMKRLEQANSMIKTDVEIPDDIVTKPLEQARNELALYKNALDAYLNATASAADEVRKFLNSKSSVINISEDKAIEGLKTRAEELKPTFSPEVETFPAQVSTQTPSTKARNGNGHQKKFVRKLNDMEKDTIRAFFISVNGEITYKRTQEVHAQCDPIVSIAQVTGFISYLHAEVARGDLKVRDRAAYEKVLVWNRENNNGK
jgi:hypothetical protein